MAHPVHSKTGFKSQSTLFLTYILITRDIQKDASTYQLKQ